MSFESILSNTPPRSNILASYEIEAESHATFHLDLEISCPECDSTYVVKNGTKTRKSGLIQSFECKNTLCPAFHPHYPRHGKQFTIATSKAMRNLVKNEIQWVYDSLYHHGVRGTQIARHTHMSEGWVSYLRKEFDEMITKGIERDKIVDHFSLVSKPTEDEAASIDETFFKIKKITVYVIIVRGYLSRKVLAVNVSLSRKEADMKKAFEEAQQNSQKTLRILTADAWGATELMVRQRNQPMTLIMHRHKKPYDKAVIERIEYNFEKNLRYVTQIGVPTDLFLTRADRIVHYLTKEEPILVPEKKPKGRPKGCKDKTKRKSKHHPKPSPSLNDSKENTTNEKKNAALKDSFMSSIKENAFISK